ncbi:phosphotransferase [Alkalicoccus luteus]|uniref:phosphotransferase n=1 Tax=Alkalicoccus luteus TaxID=1237094 RepID=UPI00403392BF
MHVLYQEIGKRWAVMKSNAKQMALHLQANSQFMQQGKYIVFANYAFNKNNRRLFYNTFNIVRESSVIKHFLKQSGSRLFTVSVTSAEKDDFQAGIMIVTRGGELKLFDFSKEEVMTIYKDKKQMMHEAEAWSVFSPYYPMPELIETNQDTMTIRESFVWNRPNNIWSIQEKEEVMNSVLKHTGSMIRSRIHLSSTTSGTELAADMGNGPLNQLWPELVRTAEPLMAVRLPIIETHGDLYFHNILKRNDGTICIIDWEGWKKATVLYDLFNWIFEEARRFRDGTLCIRYRKGYYDEVLVSVLSGAGLDFRSAPRESWISLFLLERMHLHLESGEHFQREYAQIYQQFYEDWVVRPLNEVKQKKF